jgi:hypothetical protein
LLEQGIAEGLEERPLEVDPYADKDWVGEYWDYYHFEFKNFTSRQCHSVFLNRLYMDSVADILRESTDIRCLINFGSFCGYFDHQVALRFPDLKVIGFDRDTDAIKRNREQFVAHNLEFRSDDLDDVLGQACDLGAVAVAHIRTCTLLYPAGVRALYGACQRAGVAVILGIESTGYSWQIDRFPDPNDAERPPVVMFGVMVDHNYRQLLGETGYRMRQQDFFLYPLLSVVRSLQEQLIPMCFVAERR